MTERVIYKYPLSPQNCDILLPVGSTIRHVGQQNGDLFLWVEVWKDGIPQELRRFRVYGTGWTLPQHYRFIGTVQLPGVELVWHVIELMP